MNSNTRRVSKGEKVNKMWQKLFDQHQFKYKNQVYLREKEEYDNK